MNKKTILLLAMLCGLLASCFKDDEVTLNNYCYIKNVSLGNIKRWNQGRGRKTHGSHSYRVPGSMGACTYPGEVFKTKHLPGHMGSERVTVQNLEVVRVDADRNLLLVKGAIPGAKGSLVTVRETVK